MFILARYPDWRRARRTGRLRRVKSRRHGVRHDTYITRPHSRSRGLNSRPGVRTERARGALGCHMGHCACCAHSRSGRAWRRPWSGSCRPAGGAGGSANRVGACACGASRPASGCANCTRASCGRPRRIPRASHDLESDDPAGCSRQRGRRSIASGAEQCVRHRAG